ncbi:MAG: glycoside hydrolase family 13 protein [Anaerolineaceae bacterium]
MSKKPVMQIALCVVFILSLVLPAIPARAAELQSSSPTIDGIVDPEYGPAVATDPTGDSQGGDPVDLTNLWVTEDAIHLFIAFEVNTDFTANNWGKYVLYVDTSGDVSGASVDGWGRSVTVADPHRPEFAVYTYMDSGTYGPEDTQLWAWDGTSWAQTGTVEAAASLSGTTSMVEWSIPKTSLGTPDRLWVEVWSTGGGGTDNAQDTLNFPSNDWQATDWGSPATLSVSTPIVLVDGNIDPVYGFPIATDPSGDGNGNANMDLLNLYVSEDASQYYFAYSINADISAANWGKYILYIDTTNSTTGAPSDAWGRNVVVNDPHKPEFGLYSYLGDGTYGIEDTQFWAWDGSAWGQTSGVNEAALGIGTISLIEWAVEKNRLGNPDTLWLEVWDTGGGGADNAQDAINDPADDWNATDWATQSVLSNSTQFPKATEPPVASHDNNVWWTQLGHDSRDTLYRNPGGPVTTDVPVTLRLRAAQGDLTEAKLRLYNDRTNVQSMLPMSITYSDGTYDWWEVQVPVSADPTVYWYCFVVTDGTDTDYYEDDAARTMGWGQAFDESPDYSYQLTVYDPDFQTPDWIKNAVVYQVFPDRFRDGNETNNKPAGTFFYNEPGGTVYRSLGTNWNEPICDPRGTDGCAGTYSKNFYGGDLQGLIDKLDYLQNLGVTAIYLNPIFDSPSNHGYDTTDYMAINPMFGDATLFNTLAAEINTRGMHLILDGVFNHVSSDSIYFDRYENFGELGACESIDSPYRSWFYFTDVAAGSGPCVGSDGTPGGATYESWWGYDSLPKMDSTNPEVRALIWENTIPTDTVAGYYMQSADGWRLDVGADVDSGTTGDPTNDYWEGFRNTVKSVNPDGYITGEEWGIANSWLLGGEWDAVMNYQFSSAVLSLWRDEVFSDNDHNAGSSAGLLAPLSPEQFDERMQNLFERYNPEALQAMLNLFGSHDTSRALFMLDQNTDLNDPTLYANPAYDWSDAINRLKGAVAVQMTMPGAPTIYYGDEVGLVGPMAYGGGKWEDDPYNRQPYPWLDETGTPFYTHLQTQAAQDDIYNYYSTLTTARNAHPALRTGD